MKKKIIRITESDLNNIVYESVSQVLNEGWKNWAAAGALGTALMLGNPQAANAQNPVVDSFDTPTERVVGKKIDRITLNPDASIKENYAKIDSLMSLHNEKKCKEYSIMVYGHYTYKDKFYDGCIGLISVSENYKMYSAHGSFRMNYSNSNDIVRVLTELYSKSLGKPFNVDRDDYAIDRVNTERRRYKAETGRTFKHQNGQETKEYQERTINVGGQNFYSLRRTSDLYEKIKSKVESEIGTIASQYNEDKEQKELEYEKWEGELKASRERLDALLKKTKGNQTEKQKEQKEKDYDDIYN